ncbi:MAG: HAD family hydrolase [Leptospirales bacterium]|nr:HAD family hydrolase [Leptospirales bacterium]
MQAVLFDFDGTLADTWRLYIEAYRRTLEWFRGEPLNSEEIIAMRPKAEIRFFLDPLYRDNFDQLYARFLSYYEKAHDEFFDGFYPGVRELLLGLRSRQLRIGLISGKSRPSFVVTENRFAEADFDVAVFDEDVNRPKPDPEGILRACNALGLSPNDCCYVGDSSVDLHAARYAGCSFVAALWSKNSVEQAEFRSLCAPYDDVLLSEEPGELLLWLNEVQKQS